MIQPRFDGGLVEIRGLGRDELIESDVAKKEESRPVDTGASGTENKASVSMVSPLDEMNKQISAEKSKSTESAKKNDSAKKPVKVAKKNK